MFWLALGTAAAVIGLALMTIGVARSPVNSNLFASPWFDSGAGLLVLGGILLFWAVVLYVARRRDQSQVAPGTPAGTANRDVEAVRGYYAERDKLIDAWTKQQRRRQRKK